MCKKIGFGGGCHWCTEAVFQSLKDVVHVEQGWVSSKGKNSTYAEAVIVHYDVCKISLDVLIAVHLYTHSCTSDHRFRNKYRSAIYYFTSEEESQVLQILSDLQKEFQDKIITQVLPFASFRLNDVKYQNYYKKNKEGQFCQTYINPKLNILMQRFSKHFDESIGDVNQDLVT